MHEGPQVPNYGEAGKGLELKSGHDDRIGTHGVDRHTGYAGFA